MNPEMMLIHRKCTSEGCARTLHSISEGVRGQCSSCWVRQMDPGTKKAMNRLVASAFNGSSDSEKADAAKDAMNKLNGESPIRKA